MPVVTQTFVFAKETGSRVRVSWRRATSNVMLGMAVGLLSYYALTTSLGWLGQRELREQAPEVPGFVLSDPTDALEPPAEDGLDLDGWDAEDRTYWEAAAEGDVFARIVIPAIDLDAMVLSGVDPADLRKGPGWIDWSSLPGAEGTCGISGHRTTYGAPFRRLDELVAGDTVDIYSPYRRYRYEVTRLLVVRPDQTEVVTDGEKPGLTLTACHPPYSARYRLAVQARLIEVQRTLD